MPRLARSHVNMRTVKDIIMSAFGDENHNTVDCKLIEAVLLLLASQLRILERRFWIAMDSSFEPTQTDMTVTEVNIRANVPKKVQQREQTTKKSGTKKSEESEYAEKDQTEVIKSRGRTKRQPSPEEIIEETSGDKAYPGKSKSGPSSVKKSETEKYSGQKPLERDASDVSTKKTKGEKGSSDKYSKKQTADQKSLASKKTTVRDTDATEAVSDQRYLEKDSSNKYSKKPTEGQKSPSKKTTTRYPDATDTTSDKATKKSKGKQDGIKADSIQDIESSLSTLSSTDSTEVQYGKILVVERKHSQEYFDGDQGKQAPRGLSIATQDQFQHLLAEVQEVNDQIGPTDTTTDLLEGLSKGTTYSDPLAALHLGDRLENLEREIQRMNTALIKLVKAQTQTETDKQRVVPKELTFTHDDKAMNKSGETIKSSTKSRKTKLTGPHSVVSTALLGRANVVPMPMADVMSFEEYNDTLNPIYDNFYGYTPTCDDDSDKSISYSTISDQQLNELSTIDNKETYIVQYTEKANAVDAAYTSKAKLKQSQTQVSLDAQTEEEGPVTGQAIPERPVDSEVSALVTKSSKALPVDSKMKGYWVTHRELESALEELPAPILALMKKSTMQSGNKALSALKTIHMIGEEVQASMNFENKMYNLEKNVANFGGKITRLDCELSTLTTGYQDELTQMQQDLESKLDGMNEAIANKTEDSGAINDLNSRFCALEMEYEKTSNMQTDQHNIQNIFELDLTNLGKEIQILSETKCDRDAVANALEEKVGIEALNGMVNMQQYGASRGDIEKKIRVSNELFNNIEINWQRALNDLYRELNERADTEQFDAFSKNVKFHIDNLKRKVAYMEPFFGMPHEEILKREVRHEEPCLSCSTTLQTSYGDPMLLTEFIHTEKDKVKDKVTGTKLKEYGDHKDRKLCYPGLPAPHVNDPRFYISQECTRCCTKNNKATAMSSIPPSSSIMIDVQPLIRECENAAVIISDKKPCKECFFGEKKSVDTHYGRKKSYLP